MSGTIFRQRLAQPGIMIAPGCYDALTALLIEQAGFPAAYLSGASIAYTRFGRPDVGLVTMSEVADTVGAIRERLDLPLIVDCDTGYGNALNVARTMRLMASRGASAIQLEDQSLPKRCGHLAEKRLVPIGEMVGKIKAALDAREPDGPVLIARTDAIAVEGFNAALDRADAYREAGAEVVFVEAPRDDAELAGIATRFGGRIPLLANMVEGGTTPMTDAAQLQRLGYSIVIYPGGTVRALLHAVRGYLDSLHRCGTTQPWRDRMLDFKELNALIGTPELLALGKRYEGG